MTKEDAIAQTAKIIAQTLTKVNLKKNSDHRTKVVLTRGKWTDSLSVGSYSTFKGSYTKVF